MCALQFVAGIGVTAFFTLWEVSLQEHVPGEALSRVSSFDYLASTILMPVGTAVAGPLADAAGTQETLLAMSAVGIACALAFLAVPSVRSLPRVEATIADQ
jgi:MFS family permease